MEPYWSSQHFNPHSSEHFGGWQAAKIIASSRSSLAKMIGATSEEVFFTSGATEANNLAILGLAGSGFDQIVVSEIEHKCVLESAAYAAKVNELNLQVLPTDQIGRIDLDGLRKLCSHKRSLVSISMVNNEIGTVQDISEISTIVLESGGLLHSDLAQAPMGMDVEVVAKFLHSASFSGHKFGGPMGIGFLFLSAETQTSFRPSYFGGGQENGVRPGTLPLPLCVGLGEAAEVCMRKSFGEIRARLSNLRRLFELELSVENMKFRRNGPLNDSLRHSGNLNIQLIGEDAQDLILRMQPTILASTGSACSSGSIEPSYVLRSIGLNREAAASSIRFSFGHTNSEDEVVYAAQIIKEVIASSYM